MPGRIEIESGRTAEVRDLPQLGADGKRRIPLKRWSSRAGGELHLWRDLSWSVALSTHPLLSLVLDPRTSAGPISGRQVTRSHRFAPHPDRVGADSLCAMRTPTFEARTPDFPAWRPALAQPRPPHFPAALPR
jgi:hypothetical protein